MASSPLLLEVLPNSSSPRLIGIARLAAEGESLRLGHRVEYFSLPARSLLNRCTGSRVPFAWTINPYRGCEFGCKYCYARYTHEFMEMRDGIAFEQRIFIKQHAADLLRQELRQVKRGESIAIGTATDPYQPAEKRFEITREILSELTRHRGLELGIITKSNLIVRDIELLQEIAAHNRLSVRLTITTVNTDLARILEPRAPRPDLRLQALRQLTESGLNTGVSCAPVLPGITDSVQALEALVRATAATGCKHISGGALFLKPCATVVFIPFLRGKFPELVESYERRYANSAFVSKAYSKRIAETMSRLRKKYGMDEGSDRMEPMDGGTHARSATLGDQLALF